MPRRTTTPEPFRATVTRYVGPDGKRCKKDAPGASKVTKRTDSYYADIPGPNGVTRVRLRTTDYGVARDRVREHMHKAELRRLGIVDDMVEHAGRPLSEHVEEWLATVAAKGTEAGQVDLMRSRILHLATLARWRHIQDITSATCLTALGELQAVEKRSAQTRNHYLSHAKQFARWLVEDERLRSNPLLRLRPISVEADRRHDRRCPTDDEVAALFAHLEGGAAPDRMGMSGPQRALGYRVCLATGYRAGELRSLTRESFDLDGAAVTVRASYSKRRRRDTQHLPAWLVDQLRAWFDAGGGLWESFPAQFPGRLLKDDLAAARRDWLQGFEDDDERKERQQSAFLAWEAPSPDGPLFFDFHALRHWYCTQVGNQDNISPKTLMTLCRHSNPSLTLKRYAKPQHDQLRTAVGNLPALGAPARQPAEKPVPSPATPPPPPAADLPPG